MRPSDEVLQYLHQRRSVAVKDLGIPGPDDDQVRTILRAAMRVPDHGRLFPWHFIVFNGDARRAAGAALRESWLIQEPQAPTEKLDLESARFLRAPTVIAVISRIRPGKHPQWEQILSAGAALQNLCLAANAMGFGTNWLTEWYAYDERFRAYLGLDARDHIAGFVYIGTPQKAPEERERPDPEKITTWWQDGASPNKGDAYDKEGFPFPRPGFAALNQ